MTAIISKSLRDELVSNTRDKYPKCAEDIKNMYRHHAKIANRSITETQLDEIVIRILGPKP